MRKEELIICFQDTFEKSNSGNLKESTSQAVKSNCVYKEGFASKVKHRDEHATVEVLAGTTFAVAKKYCSLGRTAVLNFANPENPGGGVQIGAMAQEECLCRSSNLFACISDRNVFDEYYAYHRNIKSRFYTDRLIYTKNVTVFKDDSLIPQMLPETDWFQVDVITCAAPYLGGSKYTNSTVLRHLFQSRITNILESALDNHVDTIVLGAFGCGAFKNPARLVAEEFKTVIEKGQYCEKFKNIVFAIKKESENDYGENYWAFVKVLRFPLTENCPTRDLPEVILPTGKRIEKATVRFHRLPTNITIEDVMDLVVAGEGTPETYLNNVAAFGKQLRFLKWQRNNPYYKKQFSVLGDSISTLDGYNPNGYKVFYENDNCVKSGITEVKNTWWDKVIGYFGGELLVNNSWSGSRVTKLPEREQLFPSGCSDERTATLHINDVKPDVILVYLGTNDWAFGAKTGNDTKGLHEDNNELFDEAYDNMLKKIMANYPKSEVWCCTLCETYIVKNPSFKFPHKYGGTHIEEYNEIIRNVVRRNDCKLIDLYQYRTPYDSVDGSHPTAIGMNTIATMMIRSMIGLEADRFLDCENGQHDYKVVEEYTGCTRYVCLHCGKIMHKNTLSPDSSHNSQCKDGLTVDEANNRNNENETEYVMLNPETTAALYSDILSLTIIGSGKTVQFQKDVVEVGRDKICDLLLEGKPTVARRQATFFYEKGAWFLRDNFSTNGTWINGAKIQPGKKYQLATNDEINFAMAERIIFDKHDYNTQPAGDPDAKALAFLEAGMATFAKSDHKDEVSLKFIIAALSDAPLYFPVEIDLEAMLGSVDPTKLKTGDTLQPTKDVKMRILTLTTEEGAEFIPMFTSNDEVNKGPSASVIRFYPQDYLPKLIQMDKPVIINPFSENRFVLPQQWITEVLLPAVEKKVKSAMNTVEQPAEKYIGKTIDGKYEVLKLIGRGGVYTVYLVRDIRNNKVWAMKACDKTSPNYSPAMRENILTEPYMMQRLNHPSIPKVIDIIENDEALFIVRDYIEGETLETIVRMYGAQPVEKVLEWSKQMCGVLGYLHSQNPPLIYRDMKPHNVIITAEGMVKFVDFGIMRTYKPNQKSDTCCLGTKGYAAPEQYGGSQPDARTDIFGLGMTMFRLVTGVDPNEPPYEIKPICSINPGLPKGLEYIISKCIKPNPAERYQSCEELLFDLNHYSELPKAKGIFGKLFGKK